MPKSNWSRYYSGGLIVTGLIAICLAFALYRGASQSEALYQNEANQRAGSYAVQAVTQAKRSCGRAPASFRAKCVAQQRDMARPSEREEYDLEAQRTMAVWTRAMGMAAIIGMAVGIIGLGLVWVTFRETRRSVEVMRAAVEAHALPISLEFHFESQPEIERRTVTVDVKNSGQSSATHVKISGTYAFSVDGRQIAVGKLTESMSIDIAGDERGRVSTQAEAFNLEALRHPIKEGRAILEFDVTATYNTRLGGQRSEQCRFIASGANIRLLGHLIEGRAERSYRG